LFRRIFGAASGYWYPNVDSIFSVALARRLPQTLCSSPAMSIQHLFDSSGNWIAFRKDKYVFDRNGAWVGWLPWRDEYVANTSGAYLGTIFPDDRLYRVLRNGCAAGVSRLRQTKSEDHCLRCSRTPQSGC
jgi:hypothetical protein